MLIERKRVRIPITRITPELQSHRAHKRCKNRKLLVVCRGLRVARFCARLLEDIKHAVREFPDGKSNSPAVRTNMLGFLAAGICLVKQQMPDTSVMDMTPFGVDCSSVCMSLSVSASHASAQYRDSNTAGARSRTVVAQLLHAAGRGEEDKVAPLPALAEAPELLEPAVPEHRDPARVRKAARVGAASTQSAPIR